MRAKFYVQSVKDMGNNYKEVELSAVYAGDKNSEDNQFASATPSGSLKMIISNPNEEVQNFFKPQKSYYLDFSEAQS